MDDKLLSYYNRELSYLRKMGSEFSEKHPKIAGRIRLDQNAVEDPHVSRLIESFAFLTSRIRRTIDDSFPELTESLMGLLYPDYHAPIPSMSVVHIQPLEGSTSSTTLARGSRVSLETHYGSECDYKTCYTTELLPISIKSVSLSGFPVKAPSLPAYIQDNKDNNSNQGLLKIAIAPVDSEASLKDIINDQLSLYINGQPQVSYKLYEYLLNHVTGIAIARNSNDPEAIFLPASSISSAGFEEDNQAIPFDGRTSCGHRLVAEYFTFPEKFLFVNIEGIAECWTTFSAGFNIYIYFNTINTELIHGVTDSTLKTGCVPIVNLSDQKTEAIDDKDINIETKLVAAGTSDQYLDIHTVKKVQINCGGGKKYELKPFYHSGLQATEGELNVYWHIRRENSHWMKGNVSYGTDTYISFVDESFKEVSFDSTWVLTADVLCNNRDMPNKLPFGPDQPYIRFPDRSSLRAKCLTPPTPTIQPELDDSTRWQLVTQLSLQNFTGEDGLAVLKDTLRLYDFQKNRESSALIDGISELTTKTTSARLIQEGRAAICRGTQITLEFNEDYYSGTGLYLFSGVLNDFFAQSCTINSFTKLIIKIKQKPNYSIQWPAQNGKQVLV